MVDDGRDEREETCRAWMDSILIGFRKLFMMEMDNEAKSEVFAEASSPTVGSHCRALAGQWLKLRLEIMAPATILQVAPLQL